MIYVPEIVCIQIENKIISQEWLAGWRNPIYYVFKDEPKEGEVKGDWLEKEWKTRK